MSNWYRESPRLAERTIARMLGPSLDRRLAAGTTPESSPLLAARARQIVAIDSRRALARNWEHLLMVAQRETCHPARPARSARIPIRSTRIAAAEPAVRELARCLAAPLPVAARGVAMTTVLLTDGTSPVYNSRSQVSLDSALAAAIAQLDPALPLLAP